MSGVTSQGLVIGWGDGASPEVFTAIGNIVDHDGPSKENPEVDVTDLNSSAKEYIPGLVDNGEITITVNFDPSNASHDRLLDDLDGRISRNYQITWPVSPALNWTFNAFVKSFSQRSGVDQPLQGTVTLRINGAVTRP